MRVSTATMFGLAYGCLLCTAGWTLLLSPRVAIAQMCERPACDGDETYVQRVGSDGDTYGVCQSGPDFFTQARSHRIVSCPSGFRLNTRTGQCVDDGCRGGCGQTRPVCPYGSTFQRQGEDAAGRPYAVCGSTSGIGVYESHTPVTCRDGWTLIAGGLCRKECAAEARPVVSPIAPEVVLRPDLVFKHAYLRSPSSPTAVDVLIHGQSYLVCFTVANQGNDGSGPFRVSGGGLGVPREPYQNQTALTDGGTRDGCLSYSTTPAPGSYRLQLTADSRFSVIESREDNNTLEIPVTVENLARVPKREVPGIGPPMPLPPRQLPAPDVQP